MADKKTPAPAKVEPAIEVVHNNVFEIVDNTDAEVVEEVAPERTEMELLGGLVQVTYK